MSDHASNPASPFEDLPALISLTNICFQALVERTLADLDLAHLLRPGMAPVLFALYENDGCIIKELTARTRRSAASLNSLLRRLKQAGLVELNACDQDRRAVRVRLTGKAWEIRPQIQELHRRVVFAVEQGLAPGEADQVSAMLRRVIAGLEGQVARSS